MAEEKRPDPEKLLKQAQDEARLAEMGKLKIYLGAAPGVGKTFTMLTDGLQKLQQGLDVIVGIAESHGRKEIDALVTKFEVLPRKKLEYLEHTLDEFDIDACFKRSPLLVLIDEMAHTNAPNSRHKKRWQDIKEILERGIDVYTTLNVQHIESLNDVVSQIIHTRIKETVPDAMLELADTIEVVDLTPEDLLKRLQEGKVYFPAQAQLATEHFFRIGNLIALRELALRITAERVSAQVLLYRQGQGIKHIWATKEKLLVCVGPGAESSRVLRAARRMAASLRADWYAIFVDSSKNPVSVDERDHANQNLKMAERMGAQTLVLPGDNIVKEIIEFAREKNITKIILWKHIRSRWRNVFFRSLVDELVRYSGDIDVYIITADPERPNESSRPIVKEELEWKYYLISFGIITTCTVCNLLISSLLKSSNFIMVYLLGVSIVSILGKSGPAIFASILSVFAFDFFFIPPLYSLEVATLGDFFTLVVMFVVTMLMSYLTFTARQQTEAALQADRNSTSLHQLTRQLARTRGINKLLETSSQYMSKIFVSEVLALMPGKDGRLTITTGPKEGGVLADKEQAIAQWVFDLGQMAGLGTDTLPFSNAIYVPLIASKKTMGVLRVEPKESSELLSANKMHLLEDCANQLALSLEVENLTAEKKSMKEKKP